MITKTFKKILISVFCALLFVFCIGAFAACGEKKPTTTTYGVTVTLDDDTPVSGVKVRLVKGSQRTTKTTGADGKASFELKTDTYTVAIDESTLPNLFSVPSNANLTVTKDSPNTTVKLARDFAYAVTLQTPDGQPYYHEGVTVGLCTVPDDGGEGNCFEAVDISASGTTYIGEPPEAQSTDTYQIKFTGLPDDVYVDLDGHSYYMGGTLSKTESAITIVVSPITRTTLDFATMSEMNAADKTAYAKTHSDYNPEYRSYKVTENIPVGGVAEYTFPAKLAGNYGIYKDSGITTLAYSTTETLGGYVPTPWSCSKGNHTFKITNNGDKAATAEFILTLPYSSYVATSNSTVSLTVGKADTYAIVAYTPTKAGHYKATVNDSTTSAVVVGSTTYLNEIAATAIPEEAYKTGSDASDSATVLIEGNTIYFGVAVKATGYSVTVQLKIELTQEITRTTTKVTVPQTIPQAEKPEGDPVGLPMDGTSTAKLVKNNENGIYYYDVNGNGTIDAGEPMVYVNLTGTLTSDRFSQSCRLIYMEMANITNVKYTYTKDEVQGVIETLDYRNFLRGFENYEYSGRNLKIPTTISTETYYAKSANSDGMYPLTDELRNFLINFYEANKSTFRDDKALTSLIPTSANETDAWLFACYYYDNAETDPIVGEYAKFLKGYHNEEVIDVTTSKKVTGWDETTSTSIYGSYEGNEYRLVINKTTFTVYDEENNAELEGTWSKNADTYTFVAPYAGTFTATLNGNKVTLTNTKDSTIVWEFEKASTSD